MPPTPRTIRIIPLLQTLMFGSVAICLGVMMFWFADYQRNESYQAGVREGRRIGRAEAFRLSRVFTEASVRSVAVGATPTTTEGQTGTVLAEAHPLLDVCLTQSVVVPEVLVRSSPTLTSTVTRALPRGTEVGVVCGSEQVVQSVAWVQITVEQPQTGALLGWIPGQDIAYPPICERGHVKPTTLILRQSDSRFAEPVRTMLQGTDVGIICNSAGGVWGEDVWVRVQVVLDGTIALGWVPANDVME